MLNTLPPQGLLDGRLPNDAVMRMQAWDQQRRLMEALRAAPGAMGNTAPGMMLGAGYDAMSSGLGAVDRFVEEGSQYQPGVSEFAPGGSAMGAAMTAMGPSTAFPAGANELRAGIKVYHGSPHDFDKFSMDKIGTGEGAQAYGHGLYFAENEGVAKGYKDNLSTYKNAKAYNDANPQNRPGQVAEWWGLGSMSLERMDEALKVLEPNSTQAMRDDWIRKGQALHDEFASTGKVYEAELQASLDDFLDWDKPLSEQPKRVQEALQPFISGSPHQMQGPIRDLVRVDTPEAATQLREAGIKGIRYLDAGSRAFDPKNWRDFQVGDIHQAKNVSTGQMSPSFKSRKELKAWIASEQGKTSNYVVFDDNIINIIKKYGIAGLLGGGAGMAALGGNEAHASPK